MTTTITVTFRLGANFCTVNIGGIDPETGSPTWLEASPILGSHTAPDWEELVRPSVKRFARHMGIDDSTLHGGRLAYSSPMVATMEFDFDDPEVDETLGSCGCTDYHMADCPTRTDSFRPYEPFDFSQDRFDDGVSLDH